MTAIPKFRNAKRLIVWMEKNWSEMEPVTVDGRAVRRVPADREEVFFRTKKETPSELAACVARYAGWAGRLEPRFEALLVGHNDHIISYLKATNNFEDVNEQLTESLTGDSRNLYRYAHASDSRLPVELENTISEPKYAFLYAKEILRGRLPIEREEVFFQDIYYAAKYAFEVIRGFASCRLPEELHTFMVMKSFEDPNNEHIRAYIEASESDPSKMGNSEEKVR